MCVPRHSSAAARVAICTEPYADQNAMFSLCPAGVVRAALAFILVLAGAALATAAAAQDHHAGHTPSVDGGDGAEAVGTHSIVNSADEKQADLPLLRLDELLEEVRANNPSLRAAFLEADALATIPDQVSALPDPMVMAMYQPRPMMTVHGEQRSEWRIEQEIPYPGKLALQGDVARFGAVVAQHDAHAYEADLLAEVKRAYYELFRIQEQTELAADFQNRLVAFEDVAATQYEVGTGMQQAILKAQLEKNMLSQRLLDLASERSAAAEMLARLLNRPLEEGFVVRVEAAPQPVADADRLYAYAMEARPEASALAAAETRAEKQVALAHKQFRPDFGINVAYMDMAKTAAMPEATGRDALAVGVSVKIPLQRGRLRAQLDEARIRSAQVESRQEALAGDIRAQIANLVSLLDRESGQLQLYRNLLIPQAETSVEATLSAYQTNRTDFLDLLDAERTLFQLEMGYVDALLRYLDATALLERALGVTYLAEADPVSTTLR